MGMVFLNLYKYSYLTGHIAVHSKMGFITNSRHFLNIYFYFGLSPYRVDIISKKLLLRHWTKYVHLLASVLLSSSLIANAYQLGYSRLRIRQMEYILMTMSSICDIIRSGLVLLHSLLLHDRIREILLSFRRIEAIFAAHLDHVITCESFNKKHLRKCAAVIIPFLLHFINYLARPIFADDLTSWVGLPAGCLGMIQVLVILYVIFYIDAIGLYLAQLNCVIERHIVATQFRRIIESAELHSMIYKLKCYKTIHYKLWKVNQIHNSVFGWCTMAALIHAFINMVYASFWLFDEIKTHSGLLRTLLPIAMLMDVTTSFFIFSNSCHSLLREVTFRNSYFHHINSIHN